MAKSTAAGLRHKLKEAYAKGYAHGRHTRCQWSELTASPAEILNCDLTTMMQSQNEVAAYGKLSVFYVPCGECGNPMFVKEAYPTSVVLGCEACGHESETDRLPFTESCFITMDANEFNRLEA